VELEAAAEFVDCVVVAGEDAGVPVVTTAATWVKVVGLELSTEGAEFLLLPFCSTTTGLGCGAWLVGKASTVMIVVEVT